MLELLLVRHGETDWNRSDRVMGRQPIPLNARGREQITTLAEYLRGVTFTALYASPVERALETAKILHRDREHCPLHIEASLAEIDYGELTGRSFGEVSERYHPLWEEFRNDPERIAFPGGESLKDVARRVGTWVDGVRSQYAEGKVVMVSHADVVKVALLHILQLPLHLIRNFSIDNGALMLIRFTPDLGPRWIVFNPTNGFGNDL